MCVFLPCDLTSWILTTVIHDKYQPLLPEIMFDGCFHTCMKMKSLIVIWFTEDISNTINLLGDKAM